MELHHDWKAFQDIFSARRRSLAVRADASTPIFVITDGGTIVAAYAEGESLSEWFGADLAEFQAEFEHRRLVSLERSQVDEWLDEAVTFPHFLEQSEFLAEKAGAKLRSPRKEARSEEGVLSQNHFFLDALQGWWQRVLPSAFGIYLRIESENPEDLLLIYRRGKLHSYQRGEFVGIGLPEQSKNPQEMVKYLSERAMVPVQGIFVGARDWSEWAQSGSPWRRVVRAMGTDRLKLVPLRWDLASLIMLRGWLGL